VGIITKVFPLSAHVIIASLSLSFVFMLLIVFVSECVLCVCVGGGVFFFRVFMRSAVHFL
jgi:hypothetical protein